MANIWDTPGVTTPTQPTQTFAPQPTGNPFFNGGQYGQTNDWYNTPIAGNIREQNARLAFNDYGSRMGVPENDSAFSKWFYETQFPRFQSAHGQSILHNPTLTMDQFMATLPGMQALRQQYMAGSPQARGAQYNTYAPNVRWINR